MMLSNSIMTKKDGYSVNGSSYTMKYFFKLPCEERKNPMDYTDFGNYSENKLLLSVFKRQWTYSHSSILFEVSTLEEWNDLLIIINVSIWMNTLLFFTQHYHNIVY